MKFKIINRDQMHDYSHYVEAVDKETAIKTFKAGHYGEVISCEEVQMEKLSPRSICCDAPIRYKEIDHPLEQVSAPIDVLILWCKKCGRLLDGKGAPRPLVKIQD